MLNIDILLIIIPLFFIIIYRVFHNNNLIKVNGEDGYTYNIRDLPDKDKAIKIFVSLRKALYDLLFNIEKYSKYDPYYNEFKDYIPKMKAKLNTVKISETDANSKHTSYTINKGEELVFCIRSKKDNSLHYINELLYVAIHELAHIGCPDLGHTPLFYKLNLYLIKKAIEFNIYKFKNYDLKPQEYCGINLNHSILTNSI